MPSSTSWRSAPSGGVVVVMRRSLVEWFVGTYYPAAAVVMVGSSISVTAMDVLSGNWERGAYFFLLSVAIVVTLGAARAARKSRGSSS